MPEVRRPRRGSLAYYPRKRAKRIYPAIARYPNTKELKPLAFACYKVGMVHVTLTDRRKGSPTFGQEIAVPATLLECPPLRVVGIRVYKQTIKGLRVLTEVWSKDLPKELKRKVRVKPKERKSEYELNGAGVLRLLVATQPRLAWGKKKPELFEIEIGGESMEQKLDYAKNLLGKEIRISDVFRQGELADVIAITKGKGTAGPVKRFGVKIQPRKAKEKRRHVGTLGQERPGKVRWTLPMAGQLGFARRTEFNKRVLKIGETGKEITPKGGFVRYGVVNSNYVLLEGSVPGPKKRLIMLRSAIRPPESKVLVPEIKNVVL